MYIGRYYHRLESKGRVSLPVKFREKIQGGSIITRGLDGCLAIYDQATWETKLASIAQLSQTKKANRDYIRYTTNDAQELEIDSQGRIRIEETLKEQGRLTKDIVFVGTLDHIEVWDKETYHAYIGSLDATIESQVENIESEVS